MKKWLSILMTMVLLLTALPLPAAFADDVAVASTVDATVKGGWLKLRALPGKEATVLGKYNTGTEVEVLAKAGDWCYVKTPDNKQGYMMTRYLDINGTPEEGQSGLVGTLNITAWVTSENGRSVNLRASASTTSGIMGSYAVGTQLTIKAKGDAWYQVDIGGKIGYMMAKFITTVKPGASAPETPSTGSFTAWVTSENGLSVNLRQTASVNAAKLGSYAVGTQVTVLSQNSAGWSRVKAGTQTGYMMTKFLTTTQPSQPESPPSTPSTPSTGYTAYVTSDNGFPVKLRSGMGTGFDILGSYAVGTKVTVLVNNPLAGWSKITVGNQTGFMMNIFLTTDKTQVGKPGGNLPDETPDTSTSFTGYIVSANGLPVRVRKAPSSKADVLYNLPYGTPVSVLQANVTSGWHLIYYKGDQCYIMSNYVSTTKPSEGSQTPSTGSYTAYVVSEDGRSVNVRSGAGTGYTSMAQLAVGTEVTVLSHGSVWDRIRYGTLTGYMMNKYLSTTKPGGSQTPENQGTLMYIYSGNGQPVTLRTGAGTSYSPATSLPVGTGVTARYEGSGWVKLRAGSLTGYVPAVNVSEAIAGSPDDDPQVQVITGVAVDDSVPAVGQTVKATVTPAGATVTYEWVNENGTLLSTDETYTIKNANVGQKIRVTVKATGYYTGSATSGWIVPVQTKPEAPESVTGVTLSGNVASPSVGDTLTADVTPAEATVNYTWLSGTTVVGNEKTYQVKETDAGQQLYCIAEGTGSYAGTAISSKTGIVPVPEQVEPLAGTVALHTSVYTGVTLTPTVNLNTQDVTFIWRVDGNIQGTASTLQVTSDMAGKTITLSVQAKDGSGFSGTVTSNPCTVVSDTP